MEMHSANEFATSVAVYLFAEVSCKDLFEVDRGHCGKPSN